MSPSHKNKFTIVFTIGNRKLEREFEKPIEVGDWSPCRCKQCNEENHPDKMVIMLKSVCRQLYEERLDVAARCNCERCQNMLPIDEWVLNLPDNPSDLHKRALRLMNAIVLSHDVLNFIDISDLFSEEHWKVINIYGSHLSPRVKKRLKKKIQSAKNIETVKDLCKDYGRIGNIVSNTKKKEISVTLFENTVSTDIESDTEDDSEHCMMCYAPKVARISMCQICKYSHMCLSCEEEIKAKFGHCPICNSEYTEIMEESDTEPEYEVEEILNDKNPFMILIND